MKTFKPRNACPFCLKTKMHSNIKEIYPHFSCSNCRLEFYICLEPSVVGSYCHIIDNDKIFYCNLKSDGIEYSLSKVVSNYNAYTKIVTFSNKYIYYDLLEHNSYELNPYVIADKEKRILDNLEFM